MFPCRRWERKTIQRAWIERYSSRRVFLKIPAVYIQHIVYGKLNDIALFLQPEIIGFGPYINKADIVIVVGRGKAPRTAARFHGKQNSDIVFFFDFPAVRLFVL